MNYTNHQAPQPPYQQQPFQQPPAPPKKSGATAAIVILAVVAALFLGTTIFLSIRTLGEKNETEALEARAADLQTQLDTATTDYLDLSTYTAEVEAEAAALQDQLTEQQAALEDAALLEEQLSGDLETLRADAELYHSLCDALKGKSFGVGSGYFFTNKAILVASLSEGTHPKMTLNTSWPDGGSQVSYVCDGSIAELNFLSDTWFDAVDMEMIPHKPGYTLVHFTNDLYPDEFYMLLIVTP